MDKREDRRRSRRAVEKQDMRDFFSVNLPSDTPVNRRLIQSVDPWKTFAVSDEERKEIKNQNKQLPYYLWSDREKAILDLAIDDMSKSVDRHQVSPAVLIGDNDNAPIVVEKNHTHIFVDDPPSFSIPNEVTDDSELYRKYHSNNLDQRSDYNHELLSQRARLSISLLPFYNDFEDWISIKLYESSEEESLITFENGVGDLLELMKNTIGTRNDCKSLALFQRATYARLCWNIDDIGDAFYIALFIKLSPSRQQQQQLSASSSDLCTIDMIRDIPCKLVTYKYFMCKCYNQPSWQ